MTDLYQVDLKLSYKRAKNSVLTYQQHVGRDVKNRRNVSDALYIFGNPDVKNDDNTNKHSELLNNARNMGFNVPSYEKVVKGLDGVKKYINYWDINRHNLPFEIDGIVIKVNRIEYQKKLGF